MLKLDQTNQQTDQKTGQKQYVPHYSDIMSKNVLSSFQQIELPNLTSRVFTKTATSPCDYVFQKTETIFERYPYKNNCSKKITSRVFTRKTAPPTDGHVFQWTETIYKLNIDAILTMDKVHDNFTNSKMSISHLRPCFFNTGTIYELSKYIIQINALSKLHDDWTNNLTSGCSKFHYNLIRKTSLSLGAISSTNRNNSNSRYL
ncbi:hypothetical protein DPMN_012999 [Dreissena polymorpha]|uniref:Uncharacterized protein n=1 Tax=Dreissena polymorpha TaxID=45954 RepID=A0A9D4N827_DREPO|nr:hypothetical protein DPMN_012999 [Dreissena polymorpha]